MSDAGERQGRWDSGRMVNGAAISCSIFFEAANASESMDADGPVLTARLRALDRQEVWLESCDLELSTFEGTLEIFRAPRAGRDGLRGLLSRTDSYTVALHLDEEELALVRERLLDSDGRAPLRLEFDVEYRQGWESPGGYSSDYGVRYWDDVAYPQVPIDEHRFD